MALWGDERGQSAQVGAVLLFGFLVVSMATYQSAVVPAQNGDVEFSHSQAVQGDLQRVHDAALRTAATGVRQSTSVALGTRYPSRTLFVNPPAPSGSLRTTGEFSAGYGISNARAAGEAGDYWDGDWRVVESEALVYAPGYREYRSPPETVVEGGLVYNRFDDATVPLTDGSLVDGRTVTLVALDGSRSVSRGGVTSVGTEPLSVSTTTVPVRSADGADGIRLYVLTTASESAWRETLSDELAEGDVEAVGYYTNEQLRAYGAGIDDAVGEDVSLDRGQGAVVVHLNASRTYDLRMAKVGVGSGAETPGPAYLTAVDPLDRGLVSGVSDTVVVEVRDRFNNPVSGVEVTANVSSRLAVDAPLGTRSNADGRVRYSVTPTETGNVSASFAIGDEAFETVAYDRRVTDGTGFDGGDDGPVGQPTVVVYPSLSTGAGGDGADSIPPNGTYGSLSGFDRMGDDGRTAKLSTDYIDNTVKQALRHGVASRSVPARSTYELEMRYFFDDGQGAPVDVSVVTAEGETLQTVRLDPQTRSETGGNGEGDTYLLNAEATEYVRSNGEFYLVFDAPPGGTDGTYFNLYVDYVRLRGSE